jgi:hypothetical protein
METDAGSWKSVSRPLNKEKPTISGFAGFCVDLIKTFISTFSKRPKHSPKIPSLAGFPPRKTFLLDRFDYA